MKGLIGGLYQEFIGRAGPEVEEIEVSSCTLRVIRCTTARRFV